MIDYFIICHDQNIILEDINSKKFNKLPNFKFLFVGNKNFEKILDIDNVIICKKLNNNIEQYPKLCSFTAWYATSQNNINSASYSCFLEYDTDIVEDFHSTIMKNINENCGEIYAFFKEPLREPMFTKSTPWLDVFTQTKYGLDINNFIEKYCSGHSDWYCTTNFIIKREILKNFNAWFDISMFKNDELGSYMHERVFNIYCMLNEHKIILIPHILKHRQLCSHLNKDVYALSKENHTDMGLLYESKLNIIMTKIENIIVEDDFDEVFYEKQIPEVKDYYSDSNYTKKQKYYHHYKNYGQHLYKNIKECREKLLGNIEVDKNFDEFLHEKIHPEVKDYFINFKHIFPSRILYYHHYLNHCKIHKDNKQNAPKDFDAKTYKLLNPDISWLTDLQAKQHYEWYGFFEKRNYKTEIKLDKNFDPKLYKIYNSDLALLSDFQATSHYLIHGIKEGRVFYTGQSYSTLMKIKENQNKYFNKDCVLLINHDVSLTGAPIFLYDLYNFLVDNNYFSNVVIAESHPNNILPDAQKKYHFNDNKQLFEIIENLNPTLIYSNSLNLFLQNLSNVKYWLDRTIFHLHETYEPFYNYVEKNFDLTKLTIKVVSEKIKQEYLNHQPFSNITVFPPFIPTQKLEKIEKLSQEECEICKIDYNKVVIGMSGSLCDRKNPLLFYKIAKQCTEYEFLWVGGRNLDDYFIKNDMEKLKNLYWIPDTGNPYKYFKKLDYFFLTSKSDPCPMVVLENLYLNNKIIVLKNNIHTKHSVKTLENYIEIDNLENDKDEDIIQKFKNLKLDKNKNITNKNKHYIEESYSKPMLSNKSEEDNFLICSVYVPNLNLNLDYLINLINQFNIRNNFSYKIIICLSFNKDFYSYIGDFNCTPAKKLSKYLLNLQNVIFRKNSGYDIGGLLDGLKYAFDNFTIKKDSKLAYLHNKSNLYWKDINNKIFYIDDTTHDTIVSKKFSTFYNENDLNTKIFKKYPEIFDFKENEFQYIQGTVFRTNINYLKNLYDKYEKIYPNLTNVDKNDEYWISIMSDKDIFEDYFSNYSNNIFNKPIDRESHSVVCGGLAKNYIELLEKHNLRGIPDCQFEHALERYIGYLIFNNKKVLKV